MKRTLTAFVAAGSAIAIAVAAPAAPSSKNTYTIERVTFESEGQTLVGNLYIPNGVDAEQPVEGAVVTGAWTTIKEHMPATYAGELAARGQIALAFDFRTWGESEGSTRSLENPAMKIADIEAAASYLAARPEVEAVNGLGICASAGYMTTVAERTDVFESVALIAPWLHDAALVEAVYGGKEGVASLVETGRAAATREAETGEPQLIPAAGPAGSNALMPGVPYYTEEGFGLIPEWQNTFNLASWEGWLTFDAVGTAAGVNEPVLIVHSEAAAIPDGARRFYAGLKGEKEQLWLENVTQFDFYYQPGPVQSAADAAADFFNRK